MNTFSSFRDESHANHVLLLGEEVLVVGVGQLPDFLAYLLVKLALLKDLLHLIVRYDTSSLLIEAGKDLFKATLLALADGPVDCGSLWCLVGRFVFAGL